MISSSFTYLALPDLIPLAFVVPKLNGPEIWVRLCSVFLLIAVNAFFVTAEFSIVSVRRSRINQLVAEGDIPARTVQSLQREIDRLLSTTQLGITLSSLALGWIGQDTMTILVAAWMRRWPLLIRVEDTIARTVAIPVAFLLIAYLQIVLGELCPKSVAMLHGEQLARLLGPPSFAIGRLFNPFIKILNQSTRWLLRLVGIQYTGRGWYNQVTPEELQLIIATSTESSGLEAKERELLNNVLEFGEVLAEEIMVPRTAIRAISGTATFQTLLNEVADSGHSCYPVTGESLDDICGLIYFKELAQPLAEGLVTFDTSIQAWIQPAQFVPEQMPLSELLSLMQQLPTGPTLQSHQTLVIVVDEFGGTAGLVTLEDITAEIIGHRFKAENSRHPLLIEVLDDQTALVQAQVALEEVNQILSLDLPLMEEYQTLGGFLIYQAQKIPTQDETLVYKNIEFTVLSTDGPRLNQVRIRHVNTNSSTKPFGRQVPSESSSTHDGASGTGSS